MLCKPPIYKLPRSKAPKHSKFALETCEKKQWTFLLCGTGVEYISGINFANLVHLQKVPFL